MINPGHRIDELHTCLLVVLSDCNSVLELGCGVGDKLAATPCSLRVGVDIFEPYLDMATLKWGKQLHELHVAEAVTYLDAETRNFDAIMLIDFIEHLDRNKAKNLLVRCRKLARRKIIIFCPLGECPQDNDTYDLGGEEWQTHRSTWGVKSLGREGFDVAIWPGYRNDEGKTAFAVWSRPY